MATVNIDLERLFRLRLVVARFGEMDVARWWNTHEVLARRGAIVLKRGFPATHSFARARIVFEVARARCHELFDPPGCATLWSLPADIEDQFEGQWQVWLDERERWDSAFAAIAEIREGDLLGILTTQGLLADDQRAVAARLKRSAEGRAVPLPGVSSLNDETITMLAAGFARGEPGSPAIPYARLET